MIYSVLNRFRLSSFVALSLLLLGIVALNGCIKDDTIDLNPSILQDYISINDDRVVADLIACAAGKENGLSGTSAFPTAVFFYPIEGATDFKYFEAENIADSLDFSRYQEKDLSDEPIFNGYLWKFNNTEFTGERMGVVTYKTPGKLHVCTPIRLKTNPKPTEVNPGLATVTENGVTPSFTWEDGLIDENVIYFQIISDADNNLISGTYTYEKNFTFYDLSNVVLNVSPTSPEPFLLPNQPYTFTIMAVSEDNWVNLFFEKSFMTN